MKLARENHLSFVLYTTSYGTMDVIILSDSSKLFQNPKSFPRQVQKWRTGEEFRKVVIKGNSTEKNDMDAVYMKT